MRVKRCAEGPQTQFDANFPSFPKIKIKVYKQFACPWFSSSSLSSPPLFHHFVSNFPRFWGRRGVEDIILPNLLHRFTLRVRLSCHISMPPASDSLLSAGSINSNVLRELEPRTHSRSWSTSLEIPLALDFFSTSTPGLLGFPSHFGEQSFLYYSSVTITYVR